MSLDKGGKWLVLLGLAATLLVLSGASGLAQAEPWGDQTFRPQPGQEAAYVPGEVLVKFKGSPATFRGKPTREQLLSVHGAAAAEFVAALPNQAQAALQKVQGQVLRVHPSIGVLHVKLPPQLSVSQAIESLYRSGMVEYAEPNVLIKAQSDPATNDPLLTSQWSLPVIKAPEAWNIVYPGGVVPADPYSKNTIVAVIDSGVKYDQDDFYVNGFPPGYSFPNPPTILNNLWVNSLHPLGPLPQGFNDGKDDDNNGFVNDYFGINTVPPPNPPPPPNDVMDTGGHGTALAGIIGAFGNNNRGIAGINWQTQIMALKFMNSNTGNAADAITCINYALQQLANAQQVAPKTHLVLTLGWSQSPSYTYSQSVHGALQVAQLAGALVVAAAGNNDEDNDIFPNYPSCYAHEVLDYQGNPVDPSAVSLDNIISVGASDESDKRLFNSSLGIYSSYGMATVDLFAPGSNIYSTKISGTPPYGNVGSGTSLAAAHVAGACALLWNQYPDKDWTQIKGMIMNGAEDAPDFRAICATEGRLNLLNSLLVPENKPAVFSIFEVPPTVGTDPVIVPGRADTGDRIVITGVNFGASGTLSFLGTTFPPANIVRWNTPDHPNQIVATVPEGLPKGTGRLKVTNEAGLTSRGCCFSNISRERLVGNLILGRGLAASAQVGNDVWIIGGLSYWGTVPQVERYSLDTNHTMIDSNWMMPLPVSNAGAAAIGSNIYVVGGATEDPAFTGSFVPVANLQVFDTATQTWDTTRAPLPQPLMQCAVTALGGKLYAIGGLKSTGTNSYAAITNAYVFDPGTNSWNSLTALPTATAYAAVAPTGAGKIWVMGGFTNSSTTSQQRLVQEYDPAKNQWTQQLHLIRPRGGAAGLNYGGTVFCLRGTKPSILNSSYYDEYADGEWYNTAWGYWMPSILNYLGIWVSPPNVLARSGLYMPSPGKYRDKIYLLGGVSSTDSTYKYSYSNKVWAFPAPTPAKSSLPMGVLLLLLGD